MKTHILKTLPTVLALLMMPVLANSQSSGWTQSMYCPGWNNPTNFSSGNMAPTSSIPGVGYYSGQGGQVSNPHDCPDVFTANTGINWTTLYTATQLDQGVNANGSCNTSAYSQSTHPQRERQFRIMSETGNDPNTDNHLRYVPIQFNTYGSENAINTNLTKSIRIGDVCHNGGNYGGTALYYHLRPTPQNAMLFLYYAIVAEQPVHGMRGNPSFIIRVMKNIGTTASPNWQQINDTLAYYITTTPSRFMTADTCPNMHYAYVDTTYVSNLNGGWYWSQNNFVIFKDWTKVAINLGNYLYENLRIEVMIYDCQANYHYAYAYIAGECRPLVIQNISTDSSITLKAPSGMSNYEWRASRFGASNPITELNYDNSHFSFRTLASGTEAQGMNVYNVQQYDFHVFYRTATPGGHDSIAVDSVATLQTFECKMTTALDPAKPYTSSLYINVSKPAMFIDTVWRTVTATANDSSLGRVFGSGRYPDSSYATLMAIPYTGKVYLGWSDGDTVNPRQIFATQDTNFTAIFSLPDTIFIHDTTIIHDTIYVPTDGIDGVDGVAAKIYSSDGCIVLESGDGGMLPEVILYDAVGRRIEAQAAGKMPAYQFTVPTSGVYLVKIGDLPARRVVVIR